MKQFSRRFFSSVPLKDRSVLKISGTDSKKFLQGLCTNDLNNLKTPGDCLAASFLTSKGRVFANTFMYLQNEDEILLDVNKAFAADLKRHLTIYKLRSKVTIADPKYSVWFEEKKESTAAGESLLVCPDPRVTDLGFRVIKPLEAAAEGESEVSEWMKTFNLLHGLAEGPEIANRIPLECNLDLLRYISFAKGCYIGQELTARTRYKGLVRKRLVPFLQAKDSQHHAAQNNSAFELLPEQLHSQILSNTKAGQLYGADWGTSRGVAVGSKVYQKLGEDVSPVGEVICTNSIGSLGLAMINLDALLKQEGNFTVVEVPPVDANNAETTEAPTAIPINPDDARFISTFRPSWFHGLDEKTHIKLND